MPKPKLHRWRISRIRGTPVEVIGYVEAENEKQAIKQAIIGKIEQPASNGPQGGGQCFWFFTMLGSQQTPKASARPY